MADFCHQCSEDLFGQDYRDLAGLCEPGEFVGVICEGCGFVSVDHEGVCQGGQHCMEHHEESKKSDIV